MGITRGQWQLAPLNVEIGEEAAIEQPRARRIFVTGTGTEVGKTIVAAVLAADAGRTTGRASRSSSRRSPAMDEFPEYDEAARRATGCGRGARSSACPTTRSCASPARSSQTDDEIAPYRFDPPMSPHLAAGLAGVEIDPDRVMARRAPRRTASTRSSARAPAACSSRSPPAWTMRSCAVELGYPLVVVSPPGLGSINHTLLTVESARSVGLKVAAIVLNPWPAEPTPIEADNRETIDATERRPRPHPPPPRPDATPAPGPTSTSQVDGPKSADMERFSAHQRRQAGTMMSR